MGVFTVMLSLPIVCILDMKYREVPNWIWVAMLIPNIPALWIMYTNGMPVSYLALSLGLVGLYFLIWSKGWIGGADAKFLSVIALIAPISPFSYNPFQITFYICLLIALGMVPFTIYIRNHILGNEQLTMKEKWSYWPRGIPYMIPISFAFVMAVLS